MQELLALGRKAGVIRLINRTKRKPGTSGKRLNLLLVALDCGEGNGTPLQYSCLENPMDGGAWWAAVHGVAEGRTWLSDFTLTFHFHALEKEMATHSSVLAWRIPGMGEPGGRPSMGSHRVGHDWSDLGAAAAALDWSPDSVSYWEPCSLGDQVLLFSAILTPHCTLSPMFQAWESHFDLQREITHSYNKQALHVSKYKEIHFLKC